MSCHSRHIASSLALSVLLTLGSATATGSPPNSPPGQTTYLWTACARVDGGWTPEEPRSARGLFDVHWGSGETGPTEGQRDAIRRVGGQIVYEFHVPAVRARFPVSAVSELAANWVKSVEDQKDHTVDVLIEIPTPLSDVDREFLESVGATILREFNFVGVVYVAVPDESIPAVRIHPGVVAISDNAYACLFGVRGPTAVGPLGTGPMQGGGVSSNGRAPVRSMSWGSVKVLHR